MNDFTKEEMQIILLDMDININKTYLVKHSPSYIALRDKIKKKIDNYCEHEKVIPNYGSNTECDKCGEIW